MRVQVDLWGGFTQRNELLSTFEDVKKRYLKKFKSTLSVDIYLIDSPQLDGGGYVIKVNDVVTDSGILRENQLLAIKYEHDDREYEGEHTIDPVFELPAVWIAKDMKEKVSSNERYTVVDHSTIVATHVSEVLRIRV